MFSASAQYYDLIYSGIKDYVAESRRIAELIRREYPSARTILDVACGTAEHARLLVQEHGFEVDGMDIDPVFVEIAHGKLAGGAIYQGDMIAFDLRKQYDVVTCLFSAIGYARTLDNVQRALTCFHQHLRPGGLIIVEPWFTPETFHPGRVTVNTAEGPGVTVCRMAHSSADGAMCLLYFEYLIGQASGIERASEVHEVGLFTTDEMRACFQSAGLQVDYDPEGISGRGLYVARAA